MEDGVGERDWRGRGLDGGTCGDMIKYKPHIISHHINNLVKKHGLSFTIADKFPVW